jgi:hypothetical protein
MDPVNSSLPSLNMKAYTENRDWDKHKHRGCTDAEGNGKFLPGKWKIWNAVEDMECSGRYGIQWKIWNTLDNTLGNT